MAKLKNTEIDDTGFLQVPSGSNAERPSNPETGMLRYNTDIGGLENYNGTEWKPVVTIPITAQGGTVSEVTINGLDYRIHAFTSTGTSTFNVQSTGTSGGEVDVLVVGGGGATIGDVSDDAGGGAGGLVYITNHTVTAQNYTVTVGDGAVVGDNTGEDSQFDGLLAKGGGSGGIEGGPYDGVDGGSGGGGAETVPGVGGAGIQPSQSQNTNGSVVFNAGNSGGDGGASGAGGGGGGAGEAGKNAPSGEVGGDGGDGLDMSFAFGTQFGADGGFFAGGGGGSGNNDPDSSGGLGGGGKGADDTQDDTNAAPGVPNTGGGGGADGAGNDNKPGGSGIVLIRYKI